MRTLPLALGNLFLDAILLGITPAGAARLIMQFLPRCRLLFILLCVDYAQHLAVVITSGIGANGISYQRQSRASNSSQ